MINVNSQLNILMDDNGTFTDYSLKSANYAKDSITISIANATDYVYIGFEKPINAVYIDITTANGAEGSSAIEYYNGSSWVEVSGKNDDTLGLFRSGFIKWDRAQAGQVANSVDTTSKYWYRLKPSEDRTGIVVSGISLVFSDDYELSLEQPYINDTEFLGDSASHIKTHAAVKREILQKFRNKDYVKANRETGVIEDITVWDLHDIEEVKLAASYLAISKIYFQLSDGPEDTWAVKSKTYNDKFIQYIQLARLSLDTNDDGVIDAAENKPFAKTRFLSR